MFDQKIKFYRNPLEINYKTIVLLERGQMHKMHKRKEILKNSCEMTQRVATIKIKKNRKVVSPFSTSAILSKGKKIQKHSKH